MKRCIYTIQGFETRLRDNIHVHAILHSPMGSLQMFSKVLMEYYLEIQSEKFDTDFKLIFLFINI